VASENWPCRTAQSDGIFQTVAKGKSHVKAKAKLESFARQYIINHFNGQQAAIAAGFAPRSARITAAKLLAKANVQERIASLLAAANKKLDYSIEKTLQQIARHAFADPRVLFNSDGSMKKITELDEDAAAMIGGVELSGKRVKRVKITDALRALDMLARSHKLYAEDRNPVDTGVKVIILDMPRPDRSGFVNASPLPALPGPGNGNGHTR
jgi:phage terminase small subunit